MSSGIERIFEACRCDDAAQVETLLASGTSSVDGHDNRGWFPLHVAAREGSWQCMQVLLDAMTARAQTLSIDVDVRTFPGETALYLACESKQIECVRVLMASNADPTLATLEGRTPLHAALYTSTDASRSVQLVNELLEYGTRQLETLGGNDSFCSFVEQQDPCIPLLIEAISSGHSIEMIRELIRLGASMSFGDDSGKTPLAQAIYSGRKDIVYLYRDREKLTPQIVNARDIEGLGLLAAMAGSLSNDILDCLLDHGLEVNPKDVRLCMSCCMSDCMCCLSDNAPWTAVMQRLLSEPFQAVAEHCKMELAGISSHGPLYILELLLYRGLLKNFSGDSANHADFFLSRLSNVKSNHDIVALLRMLFLSLSAEKISVYRHGPIAENFSDILYLDLNSNFLRRLWVVLILLERFCFSKFKVDLRPFCHPCEDHEHFSSPLTCVFFLTRSLFSLPPNFGPILTSVMISSSKPEFRYRCLVIAHLLCLLHPHRIDLWYDLLDQEHFSSLHPMLSCPASLVLQCRYTIVHALETSAAVNQRQHKQLYYLVQQLRPFVPSRILSILLNGPQEVVDLIDEILIVSKESVRCQDCLSFTVASYDIGCNARRIGIPRFLEFKYQQIFDFIRQVDKLTDLNALIDFAETFTPNSMADIANF